MTNPRLQEIVDDFASVGDKDRLQLLLEFSEELPALPGRYADHHELLESVPECQTPLFLAVEVGADNTVRLFFDAPREAPTTRGFAGILHAGLDGMPADEVLATPRSSPASSGSRTWSARSGCAAWPRCSPRSRIRFATTRRHRPF